MYVKGAPILLGPICSSTLPVQLLDEAPAEDAVVGTGVAAWPSSIAGSLERLTGMTVGGSPAK